MAWLGVQGEARSVKAWQAWRGTVWHGKTRHGMARQAWQGMARLGSDGAAGRGKAGAARQGSARPGAAWQGMAWQARIEYGTAFSVQPVWLGGFSESVMRIERWHLQRKTRVWRS